MTRFASALSRHPVPSHAVGETAGSLLEQLEGEDPDLLVCFASPHFVGALDDLVHALRNLIEARVLVGATAVSIIGTGEEVEGAPALSLFAAVLPEATLTPVALHLEDTPDGPAIVGWPDLEIEPSTLLLLADPFSFPVDGFLRRLNESRPELTVIGGLASAAAHPGGNRLVLDDLLTPAGAVGVFVDGVEVRTVVSQGCRPIGQPFVVTRAEQNFVVELVGADRESGALAVGDQVEVGQTVQFHVRDAGAADEDLRTLLEGADASGALVFTCNGRGRHLFGVPDHDAGVLAELLGPIPAAGAFCAGEIGPVGGQNFLHGFTASVALFP
jgi:small ligand-binding sensory domain FIST